MMAGCEASDLIEGEDQKLPVILLVLQIKTASSGFRPHHSSLFVSNQQTRTKQGETIMHAQFRRNFRLALLAMGLLFVLSTETRAQNGVILIDQATVLAAGGFPFKIFASGSYQLSSNLTVPDANTTAIEVNEPDGAIPNVFLDLNGFSIIGKSVQGTGVGVNSLRARTTITNGTIIGMGSQGIFFSTAPAFSIDAPGRVSNVQLISNGREGVVGADVVENSTARDNGLT